MTFISMLCFGETWPCGVGTRQSANVLALKQTAEFWEASRCRHIRERFFCTHSLASFGRWASTTLHFGPRTEEGRIVLTQP